MSQNIIEVQGLSKQYMKQMAVSGADFTVAKGSVCGLIGPNGAGKTTIMKMLGGLILPTAGSVSLMGASDEEGLANARKRMCFIIETPYAKENMTARENLEKQRLQKGISDKAVIDETLKTVGLSNTGKKTVKQFSLGMRQRLGIAMALLSNPEVMVLDEPINGLDPEGIIEIRELLLRLNREKGITIIISSHILSELSLLCTDYIFISHGRIKQSLSAEELKKICREGCFIHTDDDTRAFSVMTEKLGLTQLEQTDGGILLYERLDDIRSVSKTLFENDVIPVTLSPKDANLEEYYINMAGDKGNE